MLALSFTYLLFYLCLKLILFIDLKVLNSHIVKIFLSDLIFKSVTRDMVSVLNGLNY